MLFPTANHGASQLIGYGSANTVYTNPLFGFSNWSSVAATPAVFGAPATYAPVAQYSFVTPFAALNLNNNNVAFQPPAVLNTVDFGEFISAV